MKRKTLKEFIKDANCIHNNKYDYSKSIYINNKTKLKIICKKHGSFHQIPVDHLKGKGCKECAGVLQLDTESFIKLAKEIHGELYDYSKTEYLNNKEKIIIICLKHGDFYQKPNNHLSLKQGCWKCAQENRDGSPPSIYRYNPNKEIKLYFFKLKDKNGLFYKIGLSNNPKRRLREIIAEEKEIIEIISGKYKDLFLLEQNLHNFFKELNINYIPDNKFNGYTECFKW